MNAAAPKKRVRKTKIARRREIAEAAVRIMARHGYEGASVVRIARSVGISKSALYQHYHNREEIITAGMNLLTERAESLITSASGANALERLKKIRENHLPWAASSLEVFVRPLFALVSGQRRMSLNRGTPSAVLQSYELLLPIVQEGQREGTIRSDRDAADLVWAMLMFNWAEDMALVSGIEEVTDGGVSARNFELLLAAYAPPAATNEPSVCPGSPEDAGGR